MIKASHVVEVDVPSAAEHQALEDRVTTAETGITALDSRVTALEAAPPSDDASYAVRMEDFSGADDDARFAAALSYAAAQSYSPTIVLPRREITITGGPYNLFDGLRLTGPFGTGEREFSTAGRQCVMHVGGPALFQVPADVKHLWISGIQFRAAGSGVHWLAPVADLANGPLIQDATFERLGWVHFASVMQARHLRCAIEYTYCNEGTDTQFRLAGSDNYYWLKGESFLSSTKLAATKYYIRFAHMSRTQVGPLFITPEKACGIRIDASYSGLVFRGTVLDCAGRTDTTACQGSALLITGGQGIVFDGCVFFNTAVNPAGAGRTPQDRGQVCIRGNAAEIAFDKCMWVGGAKQTMYTPPGTPAIYTYDGVTGVKVDTPLAPYGGEKLLQQQTAGSITTSGAGDWTLSTF